MSNVVSTEVLQQLLDSVFNRPDFSFLDRWTPSSHDKYFFPRINNHPLASKKLSSEEKDFLKETIERLYSLRELVAHAREEIDGSHDALNEIVKVFHRDGQPSTVALPIVPEYARRLGGFVLAKQLKAHSNGQLLLEDLEWIISIAKQAEKGLSWTSFFSSARKKKEQLKLLRQIFFAATADEERSINHLAKELNTMVRIESGEKLIEPKAWWGLLSTLESLSDFPSDLTIHSVKPKELEGVPEAIEEYVQFYRYQEELRTSAKETIVQWQENKVQEILSRESLRGFSKKVRGQRFPLSLLEKSMEKAGRTSFDVATGIHHLKQIESPSSSFESALRLLLNHKNDLLARQKAPKPDGSQISNHLLTLLATLDKLQSSSLLPNRGVLLQWRELLEKEPKAVYLASRDEVELKRLLKGMHKYQDASRLRALRSFSPPTTEEAIEYYALNPAAYQAALEDFGFHVLTLEQMAGFIPDRLSKKIQEIELDTSLLNVTLRSYQKFGAQYALHQKKIILGDEMGLGKTITALAVIAHLAGGDDEDFRTLVLCPLAVLENWKREVEKHSKLTPLVLYGDDMLSTIGDWKNEGGIAITTYETLKKVNIFLGADEFSLNCVVVDECHKIKNQEAQRTMAALPWVKAAEYAILMSGTPMENDLEEFTTLISHVQPRLSIPSDRSAYGKFRKAISPVYLRRNQEDVLNELEPLQSYETFVTLSPADEEYYKRALFNGEWQLCRRAATLAGHQSSKIQATQDIVEEAMQNGRKVLVFSYYRETIDVLTRVLKEDDPYLPITGDISAKKRQEIVDAFSKSSEPGVLIAQIAAGGEGLNIQAASVVVLMEPQVKPSLEDQAIARSYRMGQTNVVQVYRLLAKGTIDERWAEMVKKKRAIFAATAGQSDVNMIDSYLEPQDALFAEEKKAWGIS